MPRHGDTTQISADLGAVLRQMEELDVLTDANVTAANTVDGLVTAIETAVDASTQHGEVSPMKDGFVRAVRTLEAIGDLTDAAIAPLTTVAGLIALTASTNSANRRHSMIT